MTGLLEKDVQRVVAYPRSWIWMPTVLSGGGAKTFNLKVDTAFLNAIKGSTPWTVPFSARDYNIFRDRTTVVGSAPERMDGRVIWGGDLVVHLHANAGVGTPPLLVEMEIGGVSLDGREIRERFVLEASDVESYYRTQFAYMTCGEMTFWRVENVRASDTLDAGYEPRDLTGAPASRRKIGIPWTINSIREIHCVAVDTSFVGDQGNNHYPGNCRGCYPVDLMDDGTGQGCLFDKRDNSLVINGHADLLGRAQFAPGADGYPQEPNVAGTESDDRKLFIFTVDCTAPEKIQRRPRLHHWVR